MSDNGTNLRELRSVGAEENAARDFASTPGGVLAWPALGVLAAAGLMRSILCSPGGCGGGAQEMAGQATVTPKEKK